METSSTRLAHRGRSSLLAIRSTMMPSEKQRILGQLAKHGFVYLRGQTYLTWKERILSIVLTPSRFQYNWHLANLLHRIGETTHIVEFTATDLSFLNEAVPRFLASRGCSWDTRLLQLIVELHDAVPVDMLPEVHWHPPEEIRSRLADHCRRCDSLASSFLEHTKRTATNKPMDRSGGPTTS